MKSWNNNKDCFENIGSKTIDHIWPTAKGGSNIEKNRQYLTQESNMKKGNKTKGKINDIQFSILKCLDKDGNVYGRIQIKKNDKWEWVE